jgi:hypothetical protein
MNELGPNESQGMLAEKIAANIISNEPKPVIPKCSMPKDKQFSAEEKQG